MRISDWSSDVCSSDLLTDDQVAELIFQPGFSTAEATTDLSGRGVGMDVVRRNVNELGGSVSVQTKAGAGSEIGRASCRDRVCPSGLSSVVAVYLKKKK